VSEIWTNTLWEQVERRAAATPDALMARDENGRTLTFAQYRDAALRAAAGLHSMGISQGDVVSWELPTWLESMVLVAALARLGVVQNPLIPIYRHREVGFIVRQARSRLLVVPSRWKDFSYEEMAREVASECQGLEVLVADRSLPEGDPSLLPPVEAAPEDPADLPVRWLFYTSGTTADPKGARHTDATVMAAARAMSLALRTTSDDVNILVFPFTHIGGINWLMAGLACGFPQVIAESFVPDQTVRLIADNGVTLAGSGTPFHSAYLAAQRANPSAGLFRTVRAFPGGGAPKPPQLHYDLVAEIGGVGIVSGYGLTECPILAMASVDDPQEKLAHTEGRASPGVTIKVVTVEGKPAAVGEEGEIRVKGPQLFLGYLDSSLDAEAFDADGFFRTGDLGRLDEDGYVTITGRLKDIIIRKGENISAKELEDYLYEHPKVADVAVIGLPDPASGERACAVVACRDAGDPLSFEEMKEFLLGKGLMIQKVPEQLEIVDSVPRNPAGKILKNELRSRFANR
jgi:cyclohexanecarboxylate-CoA ligase